MANLQTITPCLWFNNEGEAAAKFYTSIFKNSNVGKISRYTEAGREHHKQEPGTAMAIAFELDGQAFTAINGGPIFKFTEAVSFQVNCDTQEEIDYFWDKLSAEGDPKAQVCGWLKDKFGLSWQVIPRMLSEITSGPADKAGRAMGALMQMKKPDIAALQKAYDG
jgi:predicted 3-demethylubiquinone-9 3-methyltransferase (glyoxalase superfamily)